MSRETLVGPEAYRAKPSPQTVVNGATPLADDVLTAAASLAREGLVEAFGHVSARAGDGWALLTPPRPLGALIPGQALPRLALGEPPFSADLPREAWIHWAIYRTRPDVAAICRAQPPAPLALSVSGRPMLALHGQAAILGAQVPLFDDARLVRDRERAEALAGTLGSGCAVLLRGNGAITVGASVGEAAARMWLLERCARVNAQARQAGEPQPLRPEEQAAWEEAGDELVSRLWAYLKGRVGAA